MAAFEMAHNTSIHDFVLLINKNHLNILGNECLIDQGVEVGRINIYNYDTNIYILFIKYALESYYNFN